MRSLRPGPRWTVAVNAGVVAALVALPLVLDTSRNLSLLITAICYAVTATGLGLLYGRMGYLSFAHPLLWGLGSYTSFILADKAGWGFFESLVPAILVATLAGAATGVLGVRLGGHHFLLATFILTLLFVVVAERLTGLTNGQQGILVPNSPPPVGALTFETLRSYYYLCLVFLLIVVALYVVISRSRIGRQFESIRENRELSESLGIDTRRYVVLGFAMSGVTAGLGGVLFAYNVKHIEPAIYGLDAAVLLALVVLLGGARYAWGPTIGSLLVVFARDIATLDPAHEEALHGVVLILIILLMPAGVIGTLRAGLDRLRSQRGSGARSTPGRRDARDETVVLEGTS